jgi:hypothetical protein
VESFGAVHGACPINTTIAQGNTTQDKVSQLDVCTAEGIPTRNSDGSAYTGAHNVLGISETFEDIPANTCMAKGYMPGEVTVINK